MPIFDTAESSVTSTAPKKGAVSATTSYDYKLVKGDHVSITGLKNEQQYNGCVGRLVNYCFKEARWTVELDDKTVLALKDYNLVCVGPTNVSNKGTA